MSEDKPRRRHRNGSGRSRTAKHKRKPELHLLKGDEITFESLMEMFRRLTGREPTAEELKEAKEEWDRPEKESEDEGKPDNAAAVPKRGKR